MTKTVSDTDFMTALESVRSVETTAADALTAAADARKALPRVKVEKDYRFQTTDGEKSLADLFNGQSTLVIYHHMYAPEWDKGCPDCTLYAQQQGNPAWLREQGVEFALVSRASADKLAAWGSDHGYTLPWHSVETSFADDMGALPNGGDMPAINVFVREGDDVYRTYFTTDASIQVTMSHVGVMSLTPGGAPDLG